MALVPHISICVCTYRRPELLQRLLTEISRQETRSLFTYSIIVADNDVEQTAKPFVSDANAKMSYPVVYCLEKQRNIALVRNQAVRHAHGEFVAFIDDDEFPARDWLLRMFSSCSQSGVSGVLGPVVAYYNPEPPRWVRAGRFYERPRHSTGFKLAWTECRTGNVLLRGRVLGDLEGPFRAEFGNGGEDQDFFRRAMEKGHRFLWCDQGIVFEVVPSWRWKRRFMLTRALLRGRNSIRHRGSRHRSVMKSIIAVPIYFITLPFFLIVGHHHFMRYLIKLADHLGLLLGSIGLEPVRERPM